MPMLQWLRRLRGSEKGNVLMVGAASMPLLIGSAALAVDTIQLSLWKRQLQRAADSGAIAGAHAINQGAFGDSLDTQVDHDLDENEHTVLTDVIVDTGSYGDGALSSDSCAARGITPCFDQAVQVTLASRRTLPFISIFTDSPTDLRAAAVAAVVDQGQYCVVSLYEGEDAGIVANGNANVTLGCGMVTNSRAESAITAGGSSQIEASPLGAVGGLDGEDQNFVGDTELRPYSAPTGDPLAHVPDPPPQQNCQPLSIGPNDDLTIREGCYTSMDIKGTVTLDPGIYYINGGDLDLGSQAVVNGENVTIVMTGPNGQAGDIKLNGGAEVNLTASSDGPYKGVVLYRDRRADVIEVKFNGGAGLNLTGALYLPTTDIDMLGNFDLQSQCLQMVARILNFKGTADIQNNCPAGSGASAFGANVVRLVG